MQVTMKKLLVSVTLFGLLLIPATLSASEIRSAGKFGIGLGGGTGVSGVSMKYFASSSSAFQGVVGIWGLGRGHGSVIGLNADYLYELPALTNNSVFELGWNIGFGGFGGIGDAFWLGANAVVGLEFNFNPIPIDITLEYQPGLLIYDHVSADLVNFGGHIRYFF